MVNDNVLDVPPVGPFPRIAARWIDVFYSVLTLVPVGGALAISLPGLVDGGVALTGLTGLVSVSTWHILKGGTLGVLGVVLTVLGLGVTVWLRSLQWTSVARTGATFGKRAAGIRMVDPSGAAVGFFRGVFLRRWVWLFLLSWPASIALWFDSEGWARVLGGAAMLVEVGNNLLVFTPHRRTLNDMFAGTVVVSAVARPSFRAALVVGVPAMLAVCVSSGAALAWVPGARSAVASAWSALTTSTSDAVPPAPSPPAPDADAEVTLLPPSPPAAAAPPPPTPPPAAPPTPDAGLTVGMQPAADAGARADPSPASSAQTPVLFVDDDGVAHIVGGMDAVPLKFRDRAHAP